MAVLSRHRLAPGALAAVALPARRSPFPFAGAPDLRDQQIILTYDPDAGALRAGTGETAQTTSLKAS
jgi:hypothetical protein